MKIVLIAVLLFFEICTAISLQKIQIQKSQPTPENLTDVYEIEEGDKKTVRFVYPKSEKPTLREITYFHVKETPYPDVDNYEGSESQDEDVIVTRRPFTNGHGFQFLDEDPEIYYETKLLLTGEVGDITGEGVLEEDGEDLLPIEEEEEYADALEEVAEPEISTTNTPNLKKTTMASSNGSIKSTKYLPKHIKTSTISTDKMEVTTEEATTEDPNTMLNSIASDKEKINARNRLFTQARDKYLHKKQEKPSPRHKREISPDDFPPAPTLPPLDLSILPDDVRMLISSTPTPETTYSKQKEPEISNEDTLKEDLRQKLNDMISLLRHNRDGEGNNNDDDDKEDENKSDNEEDSNEKEDGDDNDDETYDDGADDYWDDVEHEIDEDTKVRKARTFGMNLSNGRGYVWNDLLGEPDMPGMSFDVGEPQDDSLNNKPNTDDKKPDDRTASDDKKPEFTDKITDVKPFSTAPVDHVHYSAESRPIYMSNDNKELDKKDETNPHEVTSNKDLEDIEIPTNKLRLLPIGNDSTENKEKHSTDDSLAESKKPKEKESAIKKGHKKKHEKAINKSENDDLFKEIMKNEQFWKWLSDWTATYMELLMKHIKDVVEDEVASQMKTLASRLKKDLQKQAASDEAQKIEKPMHESNLDKPKDFEVISIDGKEAPITRTTNFDTAAEKKSLHKNSKKEHKKPKANPKNTKGGHKKPMEEHKESNKEHNNIDASKHKGEKDKRKEHATHDLHKDSNKNRSPTSVRAQNIFGNVVGSDKVTNIFVFYPEDDDENFEENAQPLINGANNVFTFGSGEVEIDKKHPQITGFKDESTMTDNKTQTTIKPDNNNKNVTLNANKEENESKNKEELHPSSTTTTPKGEISKIENTIDKKESDPTPPAKEDETKQIKPEVVNDGHKDSSPNDKGTALENKDNKDVKDAKAEKTKDNEATEPDASKAESTTPISPIIEDKEKKTSKQEEKDTEAEKIKDKEVTESNASKTKTTTPSSTTSKIEEKKPEELNEKNTTAKEEEKTKESEKESSKDNKDKNE